MGKSDCATKVFLSDRGVFADLVNCGVFGGRQVVGKDDLQEANCEEVVSFQGAGRGSGHRERLRDLAMNVVVREAHGTKFIVVGVENQRKTHLAMPARCMLYDAMRHAENLRRIVAENRRGRRPGRDLLSGLRPEDRLPPVVTLVVYWGRGGWKGPRTLHEMIDFPAEGLRPLCADYKLNLIEPAAMEDADFRKFRTDLGAVLHYVKVQDDQEELERLLHEDERFKTLGREAAEVIAAVTGAEISIDEHEETIDMCKAIRQIKQSAYAGGFAEGKQSGFAEGKQSGFAEGKQSGFAEGKQSGFAEGKQSGFAEGKQSGFAEGIRKTVSILKSLQVSVEQIQQKLMEEYSLTADEASKYLLG